MKLFEISNRVNVDIIADVAIALSTTTSDAYSGVVFGPAYRVLRQYFNHPAMKPFMYTGNMYRYIEVEGHNELPASEIIKTAGAKLWSFAKTEAGMDAFVEQLPEFEETVTTIVCTQYGTGYDVQKIYRYIKQFSEQDLNHILAQKGQSDAGRHKSYILFNLERAGGTEAGVFEVVAPVNKSLRVLRYDVVDVDGDDEY